VRASTDADDAAREFAVLEAERLLGKFRDRLSDARAEVAEAESRAEDARAAEVRTERELQEARETARRTRRQIDEIEVVADEHRQQLSALAMAAYRQGDQAMLTAVVNAREPGQLADMLNGMQVIARTHDRALGEAAVADADLRAAQSKLRHEVSVKTERATEATKAREDAIEAVREAAEAKQKLARRREEYDHAVTLAEEGKFEEYQEHLELLGESSELDDFLDSLKSTGGLGTGTFTRPGTGHITSPFGQRFHPILGYTKLHTGTDFSVGDGTVYAADAGVVVAARWMTGYGNAVVIDHGTLNGKQLTTLYAHQRDLRVREGERLQRGDAIGRIGSTGYSTGPHLHFEVRLNGSPTDPGRYLP
jgi:murein DD-endopeptidase MepM/ murein hydrolase activator NlpD